MVIITVIANKDQIKNNILIIYELVQWITTGISENRFNWISRFDLLKSMVVENWK